MRVYLGSLGCKLNQSEMDALAGELVLAGHQPVASPAEAEVCVFNTCAVTAVAAQKSRQALRRLHRGNPTARLVVTGCYAELEPGILRDLPGVELVAGNTEKDHLATTLSRLFAQLSPQPADAPLPPSTTSLPMFHVSRPTPHAVHSRTRSFVKIQDGCDNACTYCIIHIARGPQRSRPFDKVLNEVRARVADGYQEIVLTGVHIGAYGRDSTGRADGVDLWTLVACLLDETAVPRLRLSSIEPWDLPERVFRLWRNPRLCPHLHLPLQSGCDATLRRMGRHYTGSEFLALVQAARAAIPDLVVTTDVIVGFPGETEAEFAESLSFVQNAGFARLHVFPYSLRPGTPAAHLPGQVAPEVKVGRAGTMHEVGALASRSLRAQFVGRVMDVLWESSRPGDGGPRWSGLTGNYLRVHLVHGGNLANTRTPTRLVALEADGLLGEIQE